MFVDAQLQKYPQKLSRGHESVQVARSKQKKLRSNGEFRSRHDNRLAVAKLGFSETDAVEVVGSASFLSRMARQPKLTWQLVGRESVVTKHRQVVCHSDFGNLE